MAGSIANLQVTVKNRWPDGSLKFAVLAGRAALIAGQPLSVSLQPSAGATAGAALTTAGLRGTGAVASMGCGGFGTVTWSGADWDAPFQTWVSGPEMSSWLYRKPVGSDAHLVAWLEVRYFANGSVEVLPWIENGYLRVASPTSKSATYTFALGNGAGTSQVFSASIDLPNHCRTPLINGTALSYWLGGDPGTVARPDASYLQSTRMVPTYRANVPASAAVVTQQPATYVPLQQGSHSPGMGGAGYHGSIGLLPEWDVLYLTSTAGSVWAALQRNAYGAGRYGMHFRDEATNRPLRLSQHPTLVIGNNTGVAGTGTSSTNNYTTTASGTSPAAYASTHCPAFGYFAYLVTGRMYHLETAQFQANLHFLKNTDVNRGPGGILKTNVGANTTRGAAWGLRTLAQAAAITPDGDVLATELLTSVQANLDYFHGRYVARSNNPLGVVTPYVDYTQAVVTNTQAGSTSTAIIWPSGYVYTTDGTYNGWEIEIAGQVRTVVSYSGASRTTTVNTPFTVATSGVRAELRGDNNIYEATWQNDFFTAAVGHMKSLGLLLSSSTQTKLNDFFAWKARSIVGRLGGTGATEYLYRDAAAYTFAVAPDNFADFETGAGPWFTHWGEAYAATFAANGPNGSPGAKVEGGLRGGNFPEATSYWGNLQPALAYAVEHGVAGAQTAYNRLAGASNWSQLETAFNTAPVWSVRPPSP